MNPFLVVSGKSLPLLPTSLMPFPPQVIDHGNGPVSQYIWHPRKFGTPVPYILGYFELPGIFGTPYELGIMVPPYHIS